IPYLSTLSYVHFWLITAIYKMAEGKLLDKNFIIKYNFILLIFQGIIDLLVNRRAGNLDSYSNYGK
ncbi:MAG: hypothetical protein QMD92_04065, partial [bacterium]|nr:hypothetical protein [bacterium]